MRSNWWSKKVKKAQILSDKQAITVRKSLRLAQLLHLARINLRVHKSKEASKIIQRLQMVKETKQPNNAGQLGKAQQS